MPNLLDFSVINQRVIEIRKSSDNYTSGEAFDRLALQIILNLSDDEIENALTDGPMDDGIDAIYISGQDIHLLSCKYTDKFENSQANFPETAMDKMMSGITRIMEKRTVEESVNPALWDGVQAIWSAIERGETKLIVHFVSNKEIPAVYAIQKFQRDMYGYRGYDVQYWDARRLADRIIDQKSSKPDGDLKLIGRQYFDKSQGNVKGIVAPISAIDLLTLVSQDNKIGHLREDAFNDNIRIYYSLANKINREIHDTALSDENYNFFYLNNGITIVCDDVEYSPSSSPTLKLKGLQVVNGGQTTHALAQAYLKDPDKISDVFVLVKVFSTRDREFSEKIGEKTNRQTPISSRDLVANDAIQKKLEEEFFALGYYYQRKNRQFKDMVDKPVIDSELLGQLYLSYYLDKPSEARNQKSIIFGESYEEIFSNNTSARNMLVPYELYIPLEQMKKDIQKKKRNKEPIEEKTAFISRAVFHVINAVRQIAILKNINEYNIEELKKLIPEGIAIVGEIAEIIAEERGSTYTHDKFFKERPTNNLIITHIVSRYRGITSFQNEEFS